MQKILRNYLGMGLRIKKLARIHAGVCPRRAQEIQTGPPPLQKNDQPYPHTPSEYGEKVQYAKGADDSPPIIKGEKEICATGDGHIFVLNQSGR